MAAELDAGGPAVVGHSLKIFFESRQIYDHARSGQVVFRDVAEIAPRDPAFDIVIFECGAGIRSTRVQARSGGRAQDSSA
jgi:hypothetical protein